MGSEKYPDHFSWLWTEVKTACSREDLLEGEDAQWSVGLVAGVVRHPLAPEVIKKDVSEAGARSDVRVVDDRPNIVVHQLPVERVAVTQSAQGGQDGVATPSPHSLCPDR